ncbi:MAG: glutathione transferase GstA [Arenimonas sp.]
MKLYYSPGACSLASHIVLQESGQAYEISKVDLRAKTTEQGEDFTKINPYGYVPSVKLDNGVVLNEGVAIMQYIADKSPDSQLAPANGTFERYKLQATLTFINSELHKMIGGLFNPTLTDEAKQAVIGRIESRLNTFSEQMGNDTFAVNNQYSVADAYLFTVLSWLKMFKIDINQWPKLAAHAAMMFERPAVQAAMKAEGLI